MAKIYSIKEIYYTIQGEGFHSGRPAVFCRFSGCNLWSGREEDRESAICQFCDTNFWGTDGENGGKFSADELAKQIKSVWQGNKNPFVVFTGGEPALQVNEALVKAVHDLNFEIAIETNGTLQLPKGIDWVTVSPKANTEIVVNRGDELKIVVPQIGIDPETFVELDFDNFYLQPMENENWQNNTSQTIDYCKNNPHWKLSVQTHKYLNIP